MVVVGGQGITGGWIGWDDLWMTWSCHPAGVGWLVGWLVGWFVGWFFVRPGIAKSQPGKSCRKSWSRVLSADLHEVGLELITFRLGDGACRDVARLVVAVDEAFTTDVPAGTHPIVAPLGSISGAFSGKVALPDFALFHQEFGDGRDVLDDAIFIAVSSLPLFALSAALAVLVFGARGRDRGILGR